jgi:hypothetical protein
MPPKLTPAIVRAAIEGFENQKKQLDAQIVELRKFLEGDTPERAAIPQADSRKRRKFSLAAIKRMREAQKLRWAKIRGEVESKAPAARVAPKPKRKLSAAGRRAIAEATRKRWAAVRAAKAAATKKTLPAQKKSSAKVKRASLNKTTATAKKTAPAAA